MARAPDERMEKAHDLYKQGIKLIDIANQLNIPDGTVRRWKSINKWDGERVVKKKTERSAKKKTDKHIAKEVKEVMSNDLLTDKQRLFCLYYIRCFNATKAYQKAYGVSYDTAASCSYRMMDNVGVREEIARLKQEKMNQTFLEPSDIFQKYMDIAFADMNDYFDVKGTFLSVKGEIDGTILSEMSETPNGIKIKLADRMKALEWLADHMNIATDRQKAELALINKKIEDEGGANSDIEDLTPLSDMLRITANE